MGVVVSPSARETFTPRELAAAYKEFTEHGLRPAAYRFGERVLIVFEESEAGVVVLIHPRSQKNLYENVKLQSVSRRWFRHAASPTRRIVKALTVSRGAACYRELRRLPLPSTQVDNPPSSSHRQVNALATMAARNELVDARIR